jgi:uncharacterized phiE125 gp8 family phage protein
MIGAAVSHLDGYSGILGRAIINQTWKIEAADFCEKMHLPLGDLVNITSIKHYDADNAQQTVATSVYAAFTDSLGPFIELKSGQTWPAVYDRADAVEIIWIAGFGATSASVPEAIRHAIALLTAHFYEHREAVGEGGFDELPFAVRALISPWRQVGL